MDNDNRKSIAVDLQVVGHEQSAVKHGPELRTHVRFTIEEWERIQNDHIVTGKSIPVLLKLTYFKGPPLSPLMNPMDQRAVLVELRRIGNNINQIAKHLNSGFREGWNEGFIEVRESVAALRQFVTGICGNH